MFVLRPYTHLNCKALSFGASVKEDKICLGCQATFLGRQFVPRSDLFPVDTIKFIKRISSGWLVFVY